MTQKNWVLDPGKFLSKEDVRRLKDAVKQKAAQSLQLNQKIAVRDYFIMDMALSTGLRVAEIARLNCGDLFLSNAIPSLLVRKGKGGKKRLVFFNRIFKKHCHEYLSWKQDIGESVAPEQPLILSSNTGKHMTTRALQKTFKRCAGSAGLSPGYSIHCLRHTYACFLLKASNWNMRLVQKQLGHSRISTTQIYADIMMPDIKNAVEKLYP